MRIRPVFATDRADIVLAVRAVGGADLDQPGAGARHDVRHAEGAADLDQLAARDDRLAALGQRVEHEQHGGGIVVDDGGVLGAGQLAEKAAQMIVALAAPAAVEVEFERHGAAHRRDRRLDRCLGEQRAAEIGVQHGAGQIEDRPQARRGRLHAMRRAAADAAASSARGSGRARRLARAAERVAHARRRPAARPKRSTASRAGVGVRSTSSTEGRLAQVAGCRDLPSAHPQ